MERRSSDRERSEDIGYMKAMIEENARNTAHLIASLRDHNKKDEEFHDNIMAALAQVREEVSAYKMIIRGIKISFAVVVAVLTFKFGDIASLFKS